MPDGIFAISMTLLALEVRIPESSLFNAGVFGLAMPLTSLLSQIDHGSAAWSTLIWLALLLDNHFTRVVNRLRR